MGLAIIVPNADFSTSSMGKVTIDTSEPLTSLSVIGESVITGGQNACTFTVNYIPSTTSERGVTWSITSGSSYASITTDGVLSILSGANSSSVTVRATSVVNNRIYAEKSVVVTYVASAADLWSEALRDSDCAAYMSGKSKLYEKTDELVLNGTSLGTPVTQPITSLSQSYFVLFDVTFESQVSSATAPCLFARMGDNFNICCHPDTSAKVWMAQPNFGGSYAGIQLGLGGRTFAGRVKMMVYYDRANKKMWAKNLTSGNIVPLTTVGNAGGTLRPEVYLFGGTDITNGFKGTIHSFYIGG